MSLLKDEKIVDASKRILEASYNVISIERDTTPCKDFTVYRYKSLTKEFDKVSKGGLV